MRFPLRFELPGFVCRTCQRGDSTPVLTVDRLVASREYEFVAHCSHVPASLADLCPAYRGVATQTAYEQWVRLGQHTAAETAEGQFRVFGAHYLDLVLPFGRSWRGAIETASSDADKAPSSLSPYVRNQVAQACVEHAAAEASWRLTGWPSPIEFFAVACYVVGRRRGLVEGAAAEALVRMAAGHVFDFKPVV
jgi:hypothetical protein